MDRNRAPDSLPVEDPHAAALRAERAALAEHAFTAAILETVANVVVVLDPQGRIVRVNEACKRLTGYTGEELIGRAVFDVFIHEDELRGVREAFQALRAGQFPNHHENRWRMKNGSERIIEWDNTAIVGADGAVEFVIATGVDVTDRRRDERRMRESQESLRASEEAARAHAAQLEAILDAVADGVIVYDRDGRTLRSTRAADALLGIPAAERRAPVLERAGRQYELRDERGRSVPPEEAVAYRAAVKAETVRGEVLSVRPTGGRERWLRMNAVPFFLGGRHAGAVLSMTDISDRKRAEEALRQSQEQLRAAHERLRAEVESTPLALVEWDAEYRVAGFSRRAEELFGWGRDEVLGKRIDEIPWIPEEDWPSIRAVMKDMSTGARSSNVNANRNLRKDGEVIACEWYNATLHDEAGQLVSVLSLVLDVTARERALASLRESEARLRLALDAARLVAWELDPVTRRVTLTENAAEVLANRPGRPHGDGEHGDSMIHPDDVEPHRALVEAAVERAGSYVSVYRQVAADGGVLWLEERGRALTDASGRTVRLVGVTQDITERKQAEDAIREANDRLREADERKNEFLGMLSHELRNPLAPIRNALYILDRAEPSGQQARRAKEILNRQIAHVTRLVDDLLDVTRIARGKIDLRRGDLDLVALARRTADDHRPVMSQRGLEFVVDLPLEPVLVNGDETRLAQVLGNLLHNASKFTPAGGRVTLSVRGGERAAVHVTDTGVGMDAATMQTIFEPFTQAEQTLARSEGGLGLGLALVRGIVALHGGEVTVTSGGAGRGTEFVVALPLAARRESERASSARAAAPARVRRVLVIDDSRDAAETLAQLVELMGHEAEVAYDGPTALALARAHRPDLVLCDIGLPGMDGYEVARQLRAAGASDVRLVALSGYAQPDDVARALQAGFDAHVAKPPDPDWLAGLLS